ncbi:MAG: helix-turn-helix transcriptional regulator [Acidaminococcaceae bacterium]|nr:helix-turn-helix transcriptional regulator [Acidaminococcaceae bacterium]
MTTINGFRVWDDEYDREHFTQEEIAQSDLQAALIAAMIETRKEKNISQRDLEKLSGVKQPVIARIEKGENSPQVNTLLKLLAAMGKTLAIVPLKTAAKPGA